ncbi:hypothetical protein GCM10009067_33360 [Haloarcula sebkhae]|uniref:Uncharacterized protein n=1 Tax=Haloarcula sebkhae TaxID=932660 RepID=A0A830EUW7_9EURY|nr:hypothetical protein GCM10009067_33360 [Haloarcula sebkhae]
MSVGQPSTVLADAERARPPQLFPDPAVPQALGFLLAYAGARSAELVAVSDDEDFQNSRLIVV